VIIQGRSYLKISKHMQNKIILNTHRTFNLAFILNSFLFHETTKIQECCNSKKSSNYKAQNLYIVVTFYLFREDMTVSRVNNYNSMLHIMVNNKQ